MSLRLKHTPRQNLKKCREDLDKPLWLVVEEIKEMFPDLRLSLKHLNALEVNINRKVSLKCAKAITQYYSIKLNQQFSIEYLFPEARISFED